jgi:outer membrane protein TolC
MAWLALLGATLFGAARGADRPLTLHEAVQMALSKNEEIAIGRASLHAAESGVSGAEGAYDPLLELSADWRRTSEPINSSFSGAPEGEAAPTQRVAGGSVAVKQLFPTGGEVTLRGSASRETTNGTLALLTPAYGTSAGVELRQPLLRGLAVDPARISVRVAKSQRRSARADLNRTVTEVMADVERAYWNLVAARLGIEVLEQAVRLAQNQLSETTTRVQSGASPETELAQPRAELERRTGDLLGAREDLARAENALKLLVLGDDDSLWSDSIVPVDPAATDEVHVDVAPQLTRALELRPELAVAEAAVDRSKAEAALARNAVWPSLDVVLSYQRFGLAGSRNPADPQAVVPPSLEGDLGRSVETLRDGDFDAASVALVLGFPIRNRTARAAAASSRSAQRQAEATLTQVRKAIRAEVLNAAAVVETAGQRITAARASREAAEVQLAAEQDRFAVGLSTNFLVLTRQNDLSRAWLAEISALTDFRTAQVELARATGSLIEDREVDPGTIER